ncbi:endonuclease/exonuclease/phosphatase family protein [Candidatus Gracilibacteria bacterium]|nr:endonuclease/exonuclease/phosphatase family protein [Candidatus Gracilibacteria bacterium]
MKIITLNTWGGRAGSDKVINFFKKYKDDIDIFCLQEIWSAPHTDLDGHNAGGLPIDHSNIMVNGKQDISSLLDSYNLFFCPHFGDNYGLLMLIKKDLKIVDRGEVFVHKEKGYVPDGDLGNHARNIQYVTLEKGGKLVTVINFHGLWNGQGKTDSVDRIVQSENIVKFINSLDREVIFCGDFNLLPTTKSITMFEDFGLINLIKEYNINSTRTSYYSKPEKFADYILVSKGLSVKSFEVLPDEVSDHSPLYLEVLI